MRDETVGSVAGVLLAAGRARRMGRLKQLLPWKDSTVAASAFDGVARFAGAVMIVVVGEEKEKVCRSLHPRVFEAIESDPDAEQVESVCLGLQRAIKAHRVEHVLLHPADHPVVPEAVVRSLIERRAATSQVLIPTLDGHGGHPILISRDVAASIIDRFGRREAHRDHEHGGLREFWSANPRIVERIAFDPETARGTRTDLDTPDDLRHAYREFGGHT